MKRRLGCATPLGTSVNENRVNFAVCVSTGKKCELQIFKRGGKIPFKTFKMDENDAIGSVRFLELTEFDYFKYEYNYLVDENPLIDPYARELSGCPSFGKSVEGGSPQIRSRIASDTYDWENDRPLDIPYSEVIAYSLHVRGFTKHRSSKVKCKGTFAGVIEKIPYLKDLGINQIHCMPIYEFEECNRQMVNYWGYGKAYYFAPKSSYTSGKSSVNELKDMIKACHKAGIEVILYFPFEQGVRSQLVERCLEYYVMEYHVDGFILNPYNVPMESVKENPILANTKIMKKEDAFQNIMRRFLKGDEGMVSDVTWALKRNTNEDGAFNYITDHTGFTLLDVVSYDGKHNELNGEQNQDGTDYNYSWNCGVEGPSRKRAVMLLRKTQIRNAFFLLLMAQGTPCILSGDEFGNTQNGNNNVYCQDNATAWLNWSKCKPDSDLYLYVKGLILLRKKHPVIHRNQALLGVDRASSGIPDVSYHGENAWRIPVEVASRQLGILYSGTDLKDNDCYVAYNMHWIGHTYALPSLRDGKKWYQVMNTQDGVLSKEKLLKNQKTFDMKERTVAFLIGR